ncbi:MAG: hypothetical protein AB7N91_12560 [Candidatus Tectimicrobiota bacterium]
MAEKLPAGAADFAPETGIYTETLARLYLRQGFPDRAVIIYRHLAQEQPGNHALQKQLQALEQQLQQGGLELPAISPQDPGPLPSRAPLQPSQAVITQLERWLHYLQRQQAQRC